MIYKFDNFVIAEIFKEHEEFPSEHAILKVTIYLSIK